MPEKKFTRIDFVKLGASALVSWGLFACGRTDTTSTPERKASLGQSTSEPILTKAPTPMLETLPTVIPSATVRPEAINVSEEAPAIPDLAHLHLEGNTLKTEQGEYAGEIIEYIFNGEKTKGVVLIPSEVKKLMEKVNTPEAIAAGNWKIAFPLDARGETNLDISVWKPGILYYVDFVVKGISSNAKVVSPFKESLTFSSTPTYPRYKGVGADLIIPSLYALGQSDHRLGIARPSKSSYFNGNSVNFAQVLVWGINGELKGAAPTGAKLIFLLGPGAEYTEGEDMNITDNILTLKDTNGKEMMVFLATAS